MRRVNKLCRIASFLYDAYNKIVKIAYQLNIINDKVYNINLTSRLRITYRLNIEKIMVTDLIYSQHE